MGGMPATVAAVVAGADAAAEPDADGQGTGAAEDWPPRPGHWPP